MDKIERVPLDLSTKDLDREEGGLINSMKSTHVSPFPEPIINNDDLDKNVVVSVSYTHLTLPTKRIV